MITVQLCSPASQEPYRSFQDETTRYVCLPEKAECQLYVQMSGSGEVKIESDEEEIFATPLDEDTRIIPLTDILRLNPPRHPLAPTLMQSLRSRITERLHPRMAFSATITQDVPSAVATVHFQLLSPEEYDVAFNKHLAKLRGVRGPDKAIVTDWQMPEIQLVCWNCQTPAPGTHCTSCGADQDEE